MEPPPHLKSSCAVSWFDGIQPNRHLKSRVNEYYTSKESTEHGRNKDVIRCTINNERVKPAMLEFPRGKYEKYVKGVK